MTRWQNFTGTQTRYMNKRCMPIYFGGQGNRGNSMNNFRNKSLTTLSTFLGFRGGKLAESV